MNPRKSVNKMVIAIVLLNLVVSAATTAQDIKVKRKTPTGVKVESLLDATPLSPNPYLSFLPKGVKPDWAYWNAKGKADALERRSRYIPPVTLIGLAETETNDSQGTGNFVAGFGTGGGDSNGADVTGSIGTSIVPMAIAAGTEDDGSITFATASGLTVGTAIITSGLIGDGPFGATSGDFDFYSITGVTAGNRIIVDIDTPISSLDSYVTLFDSTGALIDFNDDEGFLLDSFLSILAPTTGTFYVCIGQFGSSAPVDPFDSSSGVGAGAGGTYTVTISLLTGPTLIAAGTEDDGSITFATATGVTSGTSVAASGLIGDGPFGATSGDFDFYSIAGITAGDQIIVDIDTPSSSLDSYVTVWDSTGALVGFNDDDGSSLDSLLLLNAPTSGTFYVGIGEFGSSAPVDPFDSSSGSGAGAGGSYTVIIGLNTRDQDYFTVDLEAGDVISVNVTGAATTVSLFDPAGALQVGSSQEVSFVFPSISPLPGGGNASFAYVVDVAGSYAISVTSGGNGAYTAEMRVYRSGAETSASGAKQTIFLDFDGETLDTSIFGGPGVVSLSPLSSFLTAWGLTAPDLDAVIDAIVANVTENVKTDLAAFGTNPSFDVIILNSRDHADPFGSAGVSRIIIGGTIAESGIGTIGIAESIDIGNFEHRETGLVLLDLLSAAAANPNSLNQYTIDASSSKIALIGEGVGNITAHEIGHYIGNFHTDQFNGTPNIMDQGGNLSGSVGLGGDSIFGNGNDVDVDFTTDFYVSNEGFTGAEDTLNSSAFAFSIGTFISIAMPTAGLLGLGLLTVGFGVAGVRRIRKRG
jgi:hypothetical protein